MPNALRRNTALLSTWGDPRLNAQSGRSYGVVVFGYASECPVEAKYLGSLERLGVGLGFDFALGLSQPESHDGYYNTSHDGASDGLAVGSWLKLGFHLQNGVHPCRLGLSRPPHVDTGATANEPEQLVAKPILANDCMCSVDVRLAFVLEQGPRKRRRPQRTRQLPRFSGGHAKQSASTPPPTPRVGVDAVERWPLTNIGYGPREL